MDMNIENERLRKRVVELEKLIHEAIPFVGYMASVEDLKAKLESAVEYPFRYERRHNKHAPDCGISIPNIDACTCGKP